jgi:NADPH:quinone reductase-like Zn-dependent oxidoreductase
VRALTIDAHGGLEQIRYREDVPAPEVRGPHEVRVRVRAAALNRLDLWTVGGLPGIRISPPWVLGADAVGTVDQIGAAAGAADAGVAGGGSAAKVAVGDRVVINPGISCRDCEFCRKGEHSLCVRFQLLGEHLPGTFAEYVVVPAANVRRIPAAVPDDTAAAYSLAMLTAWRMCMTRAQVRAGEDVLIWGIGGGVALAALLICKARGARVWVTSSSQEKLARARALGADETLDHSAVDVGKEIRARTGKRGVDVVVESVGEKTWAQSLGALARGGRLVTCGGTSGPTLSMDVRRLFWNQWSLLGSTMGNDAEYAAVVEELTAGRLALPVDAAYPLSEGREAFARMERGEQFGKLVLRVSE